MEKTDFELEDPAKIALYTEQISQLETKRALVQRKLNALTQEEKDALDKLLQMQTITTAEDYNNRRLKHGDKDL